MKARITKYRRTKKGNYAFKTDLDFGEIVLNPHSAKCRDRFVQYFPHMIDRVRLIIEKDFDPEKFIDEYCYVFPILEPDKKYNENRSDKSA